MHFKVAAQPFQKLLACIFLGYFYSVMQTHKTRAAVHVFFEGWQMLEGWMSLTTIAIHNNGVCAIEHIIALWPTTTVDIALGTWCRAGNGIGQYATARQVFMRTVPWLGRPAKNTMRFPSAAEDRSAKKPIVSTPSIITTARMCRHDDIKTFSKVGRLKRRPCIVANPSHWSCKVSLAEGR